MSLPLISPASTGGLKSTALGRILEFEARMHRRLGLVRPQRYVRLWQYYIGQNLPPANIEQPLGINYSKAICDKHTSFFWGDTEDRLIQFAIRPRRKQAVPEDATAIAIRTFIEQTLDDNYGDTLLWDASMDCSVYGDTILQVGWDILEQRVKIERILPEYFHCRWNINQLHELTEVIIAYPIERGDAALKFNTTGNLAIGYNLINPDYFPGFGIYWEHWTPFRYQIWIDDTLVQDEPNPYLLTDDEGTIYPGIIPFIHIPNMRQTDFYGMADHEPCLQLIDEINRRMADTGDIVNNHAHPIVTLNKFHGESEDLPVGPDAIWDLGLEGEANILEVKGNTIATDYLEKLMQTLLDTASLPEIAFGRQSRSNGRAQASATAIQLILMPAVERAKAKRTPWRIGLTQLARLMILVQYIHQPEVLGFSFQDLAQYSITPQFGPILPRDRLAQVNENVMLTVNGLRSIKRALEDLGEEDIDAQIRDIKADMVWRSTAEMGGKNSDQGMGGSNQLPGSGMKPTQPGKQASDPMKGGDAAVDDYTANQ